MRIHDQRDEGDLLRRKASVPLRRALFSPGCGRERYCRASGQGLSRQRKGYRQGPSPWSMQAFPKQPLVYESLRIHLRLKIEGLHNGAYPDGSPRLHSGHP